MPTIEGRPLRASRRCTSKPRAANQLAQKSAISISPTAPGTRSGLTELIDTRSFKSSVALVILRLLRSDGAGRGGSRRAQAGGIAFGVEEEDAGLAVEAERLAEGRHPASGDETCEPGGTALARGQGGIGAEWSGEALLRLNGVLLADGHEGRCRARENPPADEGGLVAFERPHRARQAWRDADRCAGAMALEQAGGALG